MPGFNRFGGPAGGAGVGTDPIGGGNSFNTNNGWGGQFGAQMGGFGRMGNLNQSKGAVDSLQARVWQLQEDCARGSGSACIQLKTAQQQLQQAQQQQQAWLGVEQMRGQGAGAMGKGYYGRRGIDPGAMGAAMLGAQFGMGGGGGLPGGGGW